MATRTAQLVAETVAVLCPHCGEPQPNPDNGSHMWPLGLVSMCAVGSRTCVACDEWMRIHVRRMVQFE